MNDIRFTVEDLIVQLKTFDEQLKKLQRNCCTCDMFQKSTYYCTKFEAVVPATTIVTGCDHYLNEVPF